MTQFADGPFKEAFNIWQKSTAETMEQLLKNKEFLESMGKAIEMSSEIKKQMEQATTASLKAMHLPTTEDQQKLLHKLTLFEGRLTDIEDKVDQALALLTRIAAAVQEPEEPPRAPQGEVSEGGL